MAEPLIKLKKSTARISVPESHVANWEKDGWVRMTDAEIADQQDRRLKRIRQQEKAAGKPAVVPVAGTDAAVVAPGEEPAATTEG